MTNALCDTGFSCHIQVLVENWLVLWVTTFFDDKLGALFRCDTAEVSQTLLGNQHVEVVLSVVNMRSLRYNASDTVRIGLARTR